MMTEQKHPGGAPSLYTRELAIEICDAIAESYKSLKTLCKLNPSWPRYRTLRTWIREREEMQHLYAQAKEDQGDLFVEEMLEISDDGTSDYYENAKGEMVFDSEHVQRSRLRVDTRKWIASKYKPKKYGDVKVAEEKQDNSEAIEADRELVQKCQTE